MKPEFIVERNGRSFVLYAGLVDLAHQTGLRAIRTNMLQAPTNANDRVAIVEAIVTMVKDGEERVFTGLGDAAPNNVAPAMVTCLLRMAETRAKARALRDALNIGVAAFEELPPEDGETAPVAPRAARSARPASTRTAAVTKRKCDHCPCSDARPGTHHKPGCPNRTDARVAV